VAETAVAASPNADAVSISVLSWPDGRTAASTDERALDTRSPALGVTPRAVPASRVGAHAPVRAVIGEAHHRWPEFVEAKREWGSARVCQFHW
jgi:hypothetical protein